MYEVHDQIIRHLSIVLMLLQKNKHLEETTAYAVQNALDEVLLDRPYEYDFKAINKAMGSWAR